MTSRPKTFSEFCDGLRIVERPKGGIKLICMRNQSVLLETKLKPWNTTATRKTFLANLYIKEILLRVNMSKKIRRPEGFELLGARCLYGEQVVTICAWKEMADPETGEIKKQFTLAGRWHTDTPFKAFETQIQF
jgi:hypothetical protein